MMSVHTIPLVNRKDDSYQPLWSVMIPTFNCAEFLEATLMSVLEQAPDSSLMQIEVIDDCSTKDDPESVVARVGKGRVLFHRKAVNAGATANFNTCIERARGKLVHILHGDDYVLPGFYEEIELAAQNYQEVALFSTRSFIIDEYDNLLELSGRLKELEEATRDVGSLVYSNDLRTPSVVVRRSLYEEHGGFDPQFVHVADWEMWLRAICSGGGFFINKPLCSYRMFGANDTNRLAKTAENLRDYIRLADSLQAKHVTFVRKYFDRLLARKALEQANYFKSIGDQGSADNNFQIFREFATPIARGRTFLRGLLGM